MEMCTVGWVALQGVELFNSFIFQASLSVSFAESTEAKYATTSLQIKDAKT